MCFVQVVTHQHYIPMNCGSSHGFNGHEHSFLIGSMNGIFTCIYHKIQPSMLVKYIPYIDPMCFENRNG